MGIAAFLVLAPWMRILRMRRLRVKSLERMITSIRSSQGEQTYEDYAVEFYVDYDRCNPITSENGYKVWYDILQRKGTTDTNAELESMLDERFKVTMAKAFGKLGTANTNTDPLGRNSVFVDGLRSQIAGLANFETKPARNTKIDALIYSRQWIRGAARGTVNKKSRAKKESISPIKVNSIITQA